MAPPFLYALTLSNINRFSKLFHHQNQVKLCDNTITKHLTTPQVCRYTTLWNVKCLESNNWKDDFCNTLKKLITGNMFTVSVIVWSNCHILQFVHQMFNVPTLLLFEDTFKPAMPLTNCMINETLRQSLQISHSRVATLKVLWTNFLLILTVK